MTIKPPCGKIFYYFFQASNNSKSRLQCIHIHAADEGGGPGHPLENFALLRGVAHMAAEDVRTTTPWNWQGKYMRIVGSRWWFQLILIMFIPIWGKWSILNSIFQRGWNHQLVDGSEIQTSGQVCRLIFGLMFFSFESDVFFSPQIWVYAPKNRCGPESRPINSHQDNLYKFCCFMCIQCILWCQNLALPEGCVSIWPVFFRQNISRQKATIDPRAM